MKIEAASPPVAANTGLTPASRFRSCATPSGVPTVDDDVARLEREIGAWSSEGRVAPHDGDDGSARLGAKPTVGRWSHRLSTNRGGS